MEAGLPTMAMKGMNLWADDLLIIISGWLSVENQANQVLLLTLYIQLSMIALGFENATCTVIGNAIGANQKHLARRFLKLTTMVVLITLSTISTILVV